MLSRLLLNTVCQVRTTKDIFHKDSSNKDKSGASPIKHGPFPFAVGGLSLPLNPDPAIENFASDNLSNFRSLYSKILVAIQKKDRSTLEKLTQSRLVEPLLGGPLLKTINTTSRVELLFEKFCLGVGVESQSSKDQLVVLTNQHNICLYMAKDLNSGKFATMYTAGMPILVSYHVKVKSAQTLVNPNVEEYDNQELHSFIFEQESNKKLPELMGMMSMEGGGFNMSKATEFKKALLTSNNPWKVSDIDNFFNDKVL